MSRARSATRGADIAALAAGCALVASMLVQRPLGELRLGGHGLTLRSWDLAWVAVAVLAVAAAREWPGVARGDRSSPLRLYALFAAAATVSIAWAVSNFGWDLLVPGAARAARLVASVVLAWLLASRLDAGGARVLAVTCLLTAVAASVMALHFWFTGADEPLRGPAVTLTRAGGPFGNQFADGRIEPAWAHPAGVNNLGFWLAALLVAAAAAAVGARRRPAAAAAYAAAAAVLACGLVTTGSRESWVAAAGAAAVLLLLTPPRRPVWRPLARVAALAVVTVAAGLALPVVGDRVVDTFTPGTPSFHSAFEARPEAWRAGLDWAADAFPLGWGLGAIEERPERFGAASAENLYLHTLAQTGLAGLLVLLATLASAIARALRRVRDGHAELATLLAVATLLVLAFHAMFGNTLGDPTVQVLFAVALALIARPVDA